MQGDGDTFGGFYSRNRARYPHYHNLAVRVNSFIDWPSNKEQTPQQLAEAGYYHAGPDDCTRCFYCGGGVRNWSAGDIPDVEHARWFPHCGYIISKRGQDFVDNVDFTHPRREEQTDGGPRDEPKSEAAGYEELIERVTTSAAGQALLILDYKPKLIRLAITSVLNACAWDIERLTTEALATVAVELESKQRDAEGAEAEPLEGAVGGATSGTSEESFAREREEESLLGAVGGAAKGLSEGVKRDTETPMLLGGAEEGVGRIDHFEVVPAEQRAEAGNGGNRERENADGDISGLSQKMKKLVLENRRLKEQRTCKICMENEVSVIFLPCGHLVTCESCHASLTKCPLCRGEIAAAVKAFL